MTNLGDAESLDSDESDPENPDFFDEEVEHERANENALFKTAIRESIVSKKKL